jgi:anti-sigma factor RsiW
MTRDDCASNAATYVLSALEADKATEFERHLRACAVCRDEVATFQGVVDRLPMAAPRHRLPAPLRRRVQRA